MLNDVEYSVQQSPVLFEHNGQNVYVFTLKNKNGVEITISNLGAILRSFNVPAGGKNIDILLGFEKMEQYLDQDYVQSKTYLGAIIGRYANRIENACFAIDGELIQVSANLPPDQLHGGMEGFDKKVWTLEEIEKVPHPKISFSYMSIDGEEGFPGNLKAKISFELTDQNELIICTEAVTDKATALNLTHHGYFNLNGGGPIGDHLINIPSSYYLGQNENYVATGELLPVEGTHLDFRNPKRADQDWSEGEGYDQSFVLDSAHDSWALAASAFSEQSGISLEVYTDEPTVHFYTGKYLNVNNGKGGQNYSAFTGFCFETQHHANAVNVPEFPSTILRPGQVYKHRTAYRLSTV